FRSLFSWMLAPGQDAAPYPPCPLKFRSLFSWMLAPGAVPFWRLLLSLYGFDPCSPGCWPPARSPSRRCGPERRSFDPCSPGCWPPAPFLACDYYSLFVVSILVLLDAGPRHDLRHADAAQNDGVSILVLLDAGPRPLSCCNLLSVGRFDQDFVMPFHSFSPP